MKRLFYVIILSLFSTLSFSNENLVKIAGGPETGEYISIAKSICESFGVLFKCDAVMTKGTLDNKDLLEKDLVTIALAKSNVADEWMQDKEFSNKFSVIRRIGDESLFIFGKKEVLTAVGSWIGVRDNAFLLSIGLPGALSGDAAVFNSLKNVKGSPLSSINIKVFSDRPSLIDAVKSGKVMLGFIAQVPNPENKLFSAINESGLGIMGVIDPDMIVFGDSFRIKPVTVKNAKLMGLSGKAEQIETANVAVAILARKPEAMEGRAKQVQDAAIKKILSTSEANLLPKQNWMQALANTASLKANQGLEEVMNSIKNSASGAKEKISALAK